MTLVDKLRAVGLGCGLALISSVPFVFVAFAVSGSSEGYRVNRTQNVVEVLANQFCNANYIDSDANGIIDEKYISCGGPRMGYGKINLTISEKDQELFNKLTSQ